MDRSEDSSSPPSLRHSASRLLPICRPVGKGTATAPTRSRTPPSPPTSLTQRPRRAQDQLRPRLANPTVDRIPVQG
ncbi:hypothetical protein FHS41_007411 [Streptomyces violarus]|uniref:Uncharacterized protein n=1 Tax=Streptomyces violarus TaxID=67380 RepID=A0A7W4ZYC7_9ACTN|nr:hypothetical protein [Streptomyces violarus]